jgi:hypothetical protein
MNSHVTYIWTQGHKSLGLPIRVTADRAQAHKAFGEMKIREEKRGKDKRERRQTSERYDDSNSRRPRWGHLVNYLRLIYSYALTLKCSLKPT